MRPIVARMRETRKRLMTINGVLHLLRLHILLSQIALKFEGSLLPLALRSGGLFFACSSQMKCATTLRFANRGSFIPSHIQFLPKGFISRNAFVEDKLNSPLNLVCSLIRVPNCGPVGSGRRQRHPNNLHLGRLPFLHNYHGHYQRKRRIHEHGYDRSERYTNHLRRHHCE
jgi:hypothetical protein